MKVLILSFYFRPDLSAGSFRTTALVEALKGQLAAGSSIDIVTTLPNRYHSFSAEAPEHETDGAVTVTRIALPAHKSGMIDQSRAFVAFARGASRAVAGRGYDVIYATSSRLMTAVLGAWFSLRKGAPLYLDIRDIFVDTIKDVAAGPVATLTKPIFSVLERFAISRASKVNLVSAGFLEYFQARYGHRKFATFTNGIDEEFLVTRPSGAPTSQSDPIVNVLYAGNIGEGQGLHCIVPELAQRLGDRVRIHVVGDGGRRVALEDAVRAAGVKNVVLHAPVGRRELLERYRSADVLLLHLNDYDAFRKVLPSKVFEYGALGKPVLAGVAGYAAEFVRTELDNAAVFDPCDVDGAVAAFQALTIADSPRPGFVAKFSRANISAQLAGDVLDLAVKMR